MAEGEKFKELAASLSMDERQELLHKLKSRSAFSSGILYSEDAGENPAVEEQFSHLSLLSRIWFSFLSIFKAKPPLTLYEDKRIINAARWIEKAAPGVFDHKKNRFLSQFYTELEKLKESARFFHAALDSGFNRNREALFGFLGSLEMEHIHVQILNETDPESLTGRFPGTSETDLRKKALQAVERIIENIGHENRTAMYFAARNLFCLKELSAFSFDRILKTFSTDLASGGLYCPVNAVRDLFVPLDNILFSLRQTPPMTLLESLFVFMLQDRQKEKNFDFTEELQELMTGAELSLEVIREFNRRIPLTKIRRCCFRDMTLNPAEISGGEDWLSVYREYWKRQTEASFAALAGSRKELRMRETFSTFLKGAVFRPLIDVASADNPGGIPVQGADALALLEVFYSMVFVPDMNELLKTILIQGEFRQKEENTEFTESYNTFFTLETLIRKFEKDISPIGDFGKRYAKAKQEISAQPMMKRRRCEIISSEASGAALGIASAAYQAAKNMAGFLGRITGQEPNDSIITNLPRLAAKDPDMMEKLAGIEQKCQQLTRALDDISASAARY